MNILKTWLTHNNALIFLLIKGVSLSILFSLVLEQNSGLESHPQQKHAPPPTFSNETNFNEILRNKEIHL